MTDKRTVAAVVGMAAIAAIAATAILLTQGDINDPDGAIVRPTTSPATPTPGARTTVTPTAPSSPTPVLTPHVPEACLLANAGPVAKPGPWSPADGLIAFVSLRGSEPRLYTMRPDGSYAMDVAGVSVMQGSGTGAKWSPDGSQLAFLANNEDGQSGIHVVNADGSGLRWITGAEISGLELVWSPDGQRLAFSYFPREAGSWGNAAIRIVNADGSGLVRLTNEQSSNLSPAWSPDGKRIAFVSDRNGNRDIYVMNSDGSDQTRLTSTPLNEGRVSWSPDGSRLLFVSLPMRDVEPSVAAPGIYVINPDGSGLTILSDEPSVPAWSPSGDRIAYGGITVMNADGSNKRRLTLCGGNFEGWSPDGQRIVFTRWFAEPHLVGGEAEIFVINANGTGEARLTDNPGWDWLPAWSPTVTP